MSGCLQLLEILEISINLIDAPGKLLQLAVFIISSVVFVHQVHFITQ